MHGHLFFAREETHVSVSVLDLERPGVAPDIIDGVPVIGVGVQNVANQVFALVGEELGQGVLRTHNLFV